MSQAAFPSFDAFPQGMDFLKQFWAQAAAPLAAQTPSATPAFQQALGQYMVPTLDIGELDKRINDMRTVLQFMDMNTQMLRQSVSALEVQRNTLAVFQSMTQHTSAQYAAATTPNSDAASTAMAKGKTAPAAAKKTPASRKKTA